MKETKTEINGTWFTIYQEFEGKEIPPTEFRGQKLILQDSTYTMIGAKTDEGFIKVTGDKLDIYGTDGANNGRHYSAIYQIDNNRLTICYNLAGNAHPSNFKTACKTSHFLAVFERGIENV